MRQMTAPSWIHLLIVAIVATMLGTHAQASCWQPLPTAKPDTYQLSAVKLTASKLFVSGSTTYASRRTPALLSYDLNSHKWLRCDLPYSFHRIYTDPSERVMYGVAAGAVISFSVDDGQSWKPMRAPSAEFRGLHLASASWSSYGVFATIGGVSGCCSGKATPLSFFLYFRDWPQGRIYPSKGGLLPSDVWKDEGISATQIGYSRGALQVAYHTDWATQKCKLWTRKDIGSPWALEIQEDKCGFSEAIVMSDDTVIVVGRGKIRILQNGTWNTVLVPDHSAWLETVGNVLYNFNMGLSMSHDHGLTWQKITKPVELSLTRLSASTENDLAILLQNSNPKEDYIYLSHDRGATWKNISLPF